MKIDRWFFVSCVVSLSVLPAGCATPPSGQLSHTRVVAPDQEDNLGGSFIESSDIRTVASQMCPAVLSVPEIAANPDVTMIAIHPMRNSTRFVFDKDIFVKRLRIELNRYSEGRVRFIDPEAARSTTTTVMMDRNEEEAWQLTVDAAADFLVGSPLVQMSSEPLRMAVLTVKNTNLIDMNGDSFTALLRSKVAEKSYGKVRFITSISLPKEGDEPVDPVDEFPNADFFLSGQFFAESVKGEKLVLREGIYYISSDSVSVSGTIAPQVDTAPAATVSGAKMHTTTITPLVEYKDTPNVTKYLNVMVIDSKTNEAVLEKLVKVEKKITSGLARADLVLTGEVSALSKAVGGDRSDYVIMSFQLIQPENNEVIWEDAYETKRVSNKSALYK